MELEEIKTIVELMQRNDLALFELEREGFKIKLQRQGPAPVVAAAALPPVAAVLAGAPAAAAPAPSAPAPPDPSVHREITSPMVGTFYHAASPDAPPFVQAGQPVDEHTVVCIIEAMKVMNEIKAELRGVVVEALVDNGQPVQFGQALFRVKVK